MRLNAAEVDGIQSAARAIFGGDVAVRLFGGRIDDDRRGGDIDLLIEMSGPLPDYLVQSRFLDRIEPVVDEKKVDVTFYERGTRLSAFQQIAMRDGILL